MGARFLFEAAVMGGAPIEWREGSALALPWPDAAFDLVLCQQVLQFFPDRAQAAREMHRVLVPGGRVALSVWQKLQHHPVYQALFEAVANHLGTTASSIATSFSLGEAEELRWLLGAAGFRHVDVISSSLTVRFPFPERFVELTVLGAAAVPPAFAQLDAVARARLVKTVSRQVEPTLQSYIAEDRLVVPTFANIALATK